MPRPRPDPHPLEVRCVATGMHPSTAAKYGGIARRIDAAGVPPATWLAQQPASVVYRAAVAHYLAFTSGRPLHDIQAELPVVHAAPIVRSVLDDAQVRVFRERVAHEPEPAATLLLTLLVTGLRVGEVCQLTVADLGATSISVQGTRNRRSVPVAPALMARLRAIATRPPHVFHTATGRPYAPYDVRMLTRRLATVPLIGLSPSVLRFTAARLLLDAGAPPGDVRDMLGLTSLRAFDTCTVAGNLADVVRQIAV